MSDSLNLDENLISKDVPVVNTVNSYDFNSVNDRGAVTDYNMGTINASKINAGTIGANVIYGGTITGQQLNGGTITVGGTLNGNGLIQVKDSTGTSTLQIDNTGISLINGTAIVDSLGLNSGNNFYSDAVTGGTADTTSDLAIPGGTLSSIVLARATKVYIYIYTLGWNKDFGGGGSGQGKADVYDTASSGTLTNLFTNFVGFLNSGGVTVPQAVYSGKIFNLAAGTHTLNIQLHRSTAGTAHISLWEMGAVVLGN